MNIVSNTSPLIFLSKIERLEILTHLFSKIYIPNAVWQEIIVNNNDDSCYIIKDKIACGQIEIFKVRNEVAVNTLMGRLHSGVSETIIGAGELAIKRVILDDLYARNKAKHFNLSVTGTLGILILAFHEGIIQDIRTEIQKLKTVGFRISDDLMKKILELSTTVRS